MQGKMSMKLEIHKNVLGLVELNTDKCFEFPLIWLRDNCQCKECFDPVTTNRKIDWETFDCKNAALGDAEVRFFGHEETRN